MYQDYVDLMTAAKIINDKKLETIAEFGFALGNPTWEQLYRIGKSIEGEAQKVLTSCKGEVAIAA